LHVKRDPPGWEVDEIAEKFLTLLKDIKQEFQNEIKKEMFSKK